MVASDLELAMAFEIELLDPVVRSNAETLARYIHPDFVEIGKSGRQWNYASIVAALVESPSPGAIEVTEMAARFIRDEVILVTYRAINLDQHVLRSSWWIREGEALLVIFHQGTPVAT